MPDLPKAPTAAGSTEDAVDHSGFTEAVEGASSTRLPGHGTGETLHVVEEHLSVGKRRRSIGGVAVGTRTEFVEAVAEAELDRYRVEVTHVPVGRIIDTAPVARSEGDTTIIPIVEERLVTVKQLFLIEELRIRHVLEREVVRETVMLRRQHAVIRRFDSQGQETTLPTGGDLPDVGGRHQPDGTVAPTCEQSERDPHGIWHGETDCDRG